MSFIMSTKSDGRNAYIRVSDIAAVEDISQDDTPLCKIHMQGGTEIIIEETANDVFTQMATMNEDIGAIGVSPIR